MSWRFALTPKWLVRHVLVIALVASMISLGLWQLRRFDEKRTHRTLVEARQEQPIEEVVDLLPLDAPVDGPEVEAVLYRPVRASGRYDDDQTVVVENRTYNSAPGAWVLTPLRLADGSVVVVNRGFLGFDRNGEIVPPPAPTGEVTVTGLLFPGQERGRFGPSDPAAGQLTVLARADLGRIDQQVKGSVRPAYIQLETTDPAEADTREGKAELVSLGAPSLDDGPHLSYAAQWAIFTLIATGGYGLLLRRVGRDQAREAAAVAA